jgi:phosphate/sulfate permease
MDWLHLGSLTATQGVLLLVCVVVALGFEFVNGFHDTANAVATVIYTNSLKPKAAVALSGVLNFAGVWMGGIAVAVGIVKLLPVELLVASGENAGLSMVLALLLAAILWNLGTWYVGLPASSSHTLIGAILGVGLASSWLGGRPGEGVNWHKAQEIGLALLLSPLVGFGAAAILLLLAMRFVPDPRLFQPVQQQEPPWFVRALLIFTCSGVSFAHGSNDGQKGVGILMLVLIGIVPAGYALDLDAPEARIAGTLKAAEELRAVVDEHSDEDAAAEATAIRYQLGRVTERLAERASLRDVPPEQRFEVRQAILLADNGLKHMVDEGGLGLSDEEEAKVEKLRKELRQVTEYAPTWVLAAVALALGVGTTVGWKRIVVTVGEKIGKTHLTYGQGAAAELVAMSTIWMSGTLGLPVSTTHVLSSGIAGTMVAQRSGLQPTTVRNIALAWVLTLPVSMGLSAALFVLFRSFLG